MHSTSDSPASTSKDSPMDFSRMQQLRRRIDGLSPRLLPSSVQISTLDPTQTIHDNPSPGLSDCHSG